MALGGLSVVIHLAVAPEHYMAYVLVHARGPAEEHCNCTRCMMVQYDILGGKGYMRSYVMTYHRPHLHIVLRVQQRHPPAARRQPRQRLRQRARPRPPCVQRPQVALQKDAHAAQPVHLTHGKGRGRREGEVGSSDVKRLVTSV